MKLLLLINTASVVRIVTASIVIHTFPSSLVKKIDTMVKKMSAIVQPSMKPTINLS